MTCKKCFASIEFDFFQVQLKFSFSIRPKESTGKLEIGNSKVSEEYVQNVAQPSLNCFFVTG